MSDTPEADKQWAEFLNKLEKPIDVFVDFARKLERERNEAREDAKRATYDAAQETIKVSTVKSHWIEACRERDSLQDQRDLSICMAKERERERDEANAQMRQAIDHLSDIAEACQDWLDSIIQEPAVDFIKAIRDWAKRKVEGK